MSEEVEIEWRGRSATAIVKDRVSGGSAKAAWRDHAERRVASEKAPDSQTAACSRIVQQLDTSLARFLSFVITQESDICLRDRLSAVVTE